MIILLLFFFVEINSQSNPICRAKRYLCSKEPLKENTCVHVKDIQEKYNYIQPCENENKPYCPYEQAKYGKDAICEEKINNEKKIAGDNCEKDTDCLSKLCRLTKCLGSNKAENCIKNEDCNPGLFCSKQKICIPQKEFDQHCENTFECLNNCACNNNKCAFYYSIENGIFSNNSETCKSGFIKDNKCEEGPISKYKGQPCSSDNDCIYVNSKNEDIMKKKCECGFNGGAFSYCPLSQGDSEFSEMKRSILFVIASNFFCHSLRRFGPCEFIRDQEIEEFLLKKERYENFPKLVMNDVCIGKTINWSYWKYFLMIDLLEFKVIGVLLTFLFF